MVLSKKNTYLINKILTYKKSGSQTQLGNQKKWQPHPWAGYRYMSLEASAEMVSGSWGTGAWCRETAREPAAATGCK
jgi:hypothetical protein